MGAGEKMDEDINTILSKTDGLKHTLHLYTSGMNKYAIQSSFLATAEKGEKAIYITEEEPDIIINEFKGLNVKLSVIRPKDLSKLNTDKNKLKVVVDAGSFNQNENHSLFEGNLSKIFKTNSISSPHSILCTYILTNVNPNLLKELAANHDKLILSTGEKTLLSSESFDKMNISEESAEKFIKNELEMIVLALISKEPMCGTDIIKAIHKSFNVLVSPGTIYPLLHSLEKDGYLKCEYGVKKKIYMPVESAQVDIKTMLSQRVQVSRVLSRFLLSGELQKAR